MNSDKIDRKNSIGVAFSGGGLQGIAHIGAVQALYELGIHPQYCLLYTSPSPRDTR